MPEHPPVHWILAITITASLAAQQPVEANAGLLYDTTWSVDAQGRLGVLPNAAAGGDTEVPWLVFDQNRDSFAGSFANLGALGYATLLLSGPRDLLSATDARYHFRKLGLGLDAEAIARRIAEPPRHDNPALQRRAELDRLLAVRLARTVPQDPVQQALTALTRDEQADPWLRRAAQEELVGLVGSELAAPRTELPQLASVLAEAPARTAMLLVVDTRRMDPLRGLAELARIAGVMVTRQVLAMAGGVVSNTALAGGQTLADLPGEVPYEITRRFGQMRILRVVVAMTDPERIPMPHFWASIEGEFEPEPMAAGLRALGAEVAFADGTLRTELEGTQIVVTRTRILLDFGTDGPRLGAERAAAVAQPFAGERALQLDARLPEQLGLAQLQLSLGLSGPISLDVELATHSEDALSAILERFDRAELRQLLPLLTGRAGTALAPHLDALRIEHEAGTRHARIRWNPQDLTAQRLLELLGV